MKILTEKEVAEKVDDGRISFRDFALSAPQKKEEESKMAREFRAMAVSLQALMQACLDTDKVNGDILRRQGEIIKSIIGIMSKEQKKTDLTFDIIRGKDGKISSIKLTEN